MITIVNSKSHGVAALIWLLIGAGVTVLMYRILSGGDNVVAGAVYGAWIFAGWLGPALCLAVSGVGKTRSPASRICGILVFVALIALVLAIVSLGFSSVAKA